MKKLSFFLGALLLITTVIVLSLSPGTVYSANVGEELRNPEQYWTRYNPSSGIGPFFLDTTNFIFSGSGWLADNGGNSDYWAGGSFAGTTGYGESISFSFYGTQLRVISAKHSNHSDNIDITIDGSTDNFSEYKTGSDIYFILVYESITLEDTFHQVTITNKSTQNLYLDVDAIDVLGSLCSPTTPTPSPTPSTAPCNNYSIACLVDTFIPGTISQSSQVTQSFTVTGAQLGDFVQVSFDQNLQGINLFGYVSAANQVTVVFQNGTGSNITLTSGTVRIHVSRHTSG